MLEPKNFASQLDMQLFDTVTGVCISKEKQSLEVGIRFVSYTEGYHEVASRDSGDVGRVNYLTSRYNAAVSFALKNYPNTEHLLIIDHYYVSFPTQVNALIADYLQLDQVVLGASIWYWARNRVMPWIGYYDTLSAPEFSGKSWKSLEDLPKGIIPVSGVGACWIFPRKIWERARGFGIPFPPQAGSSRCVDTSGVRVLLDCNSRLWRTHETNPSIPDFPWSQRVLNSARHAKRRLSRAVGYQAKSHEK